MGGDAFTKNRKDRRRKRSEGKLMDPQIACGVNQLPLGPSEGRLREHWRCMSGLSSEVGAGAGFQSHPKGGWT